MNPRNPFWRRTRAALQLCGRFPRLSFRNKPRRAQKDDRPGNRARGEDGNSLISFALSLPILGAFTFGAIQVSLALYSRAYIAEIAREGARYAIFHGPDCTTQPGGASCEVSQAQIVAYVTGSSMPNLGGGTVSVNNKVNMFPSGELVGEPVVVTVTYTFPWHIPFVTKSNLLMTTTSEMTIVQ